LSLTNLLKGKGLLSKVSIKLHQRFVSEERNKERLLVGVSALGIFQIDYLKGFLGPYEEFSKYHFPFGVFPLVSSLVFIVNFSLP
jgi:hypothetical protein